MNKPRVGVDVDGVLADLLTPCFAVASEILEREITMDHLDSWHLDAMIPAGRLDEFWAKIGQPGICRNLTPYPGAVDGMKQLAEVADIYIVTSYLHDAVQWVHERDAWIMEHFGISRKKMVHTHAKYTFFGKMLIDDKPQNIDEWAKEHYHNHGVPVLWSQPYNTAHVFEPGINYRVVRTNSWNEVVDIVKAMGG